MTLVERLCAATGPDRLNDFRIERAMRGLPDQEIETWWYANDILRWKDGSEQNTAGIPRYTASLDAAMTLVPDGHEWLRKDPGVMTVYRVPTGDKEWARHIEAAGATPALALCIAALKAREA